MERCPHCKEGALLYRWFDGRLRMVCLNALCRRVFDAAYTCLGVLAENDEMYVSAVEKMRGRE